jgi:hypothetical protein
MLDLALIFVSGILGSSHCIGMCGPLAIAVGSSAPSLLANLVRQVAYSAGRIFTYAILGATAGYFGSRLAGHSGSLPVVPAVLAVLAGVVLAHEGLMASGILRYRRYRSGIPCLTSQFFASLLRSPGRGGVFFAGLFTGFLPCALVYGLLALATSSGNLWRGLLVMAAFGLGTVPVMLATGCGGSLLPVVWRHSLYRLAGLCILAAGIMSIARGMGYLHLPGVLPAPGCPLCH